VNKSTWEKKKICEGYFFFVAIDSMMRPIPIPQFVVEEEEERIDWERAKEIREHMLAMKNK
jgi:acyl-CoA hydrolase